MAKSGVSVDLSLRHLELSRKGKGEALNSPGTVRAVGMAAQRLCARANRTATVPGARYGTDMGQAGRNRAHGIVHTANYASMVDNHKYKTLLKALGR
ncbi:MAG: hypothetical protein U0L51_08280 [Olegusella sp.]|nr:hypothetical protein [Olegusella sp.]